MTLALRRTSMLAAAACVGLLAHLGSGCRYDPVPSERIDALGEEKGSTSETHRPGQPCLACHSDYEGAEPLLAVGGTVYGLNNNGTPVPVANAYVTIQDSAGDFRGVCTNSAGNFFVKRDDWAEIAFPLTVQANGIGMRSLVGRDGSCGSCHRLPDKDSLNASTGASRSSPGLVLVDLSQTDPNCGGP